MVKTEDRQVSQDGEDEKMASSASVDGWQLDNQQIVSKDNLLALPRTTMLRGSILEARHMYIETLSVLPLQYPIPWPQSQLFIGCIFSFGRCHPPESRSRSRDGAEQYDRSH